MAVDKSKLVDGNGLDEFGDIVKVYVDSKGSTTVVANPAGAGTTDLVKIEINGVVYNIPKGSSITIDTAPTQGSNNAVSSGGVYTALSGKLNSTRDAVQTVGGLVKPLTTPTATELVGISTGMDQERVKIGDGLNYDTTTKTLTATGGGGGTGGTKLYRHEISLTIATFSPVYIVIISNRENEYTTVTEIINDYINIVNAYGFNPDLSNVSQEGFIIGGAELTINGTNYQTHTLTSDTVTPL